MARVLDSDYFSKILKISGGYSDDEPDFPFNQAGLEEQSGDSNKDDADDSSLPTTVVDTESDSDADNASLPTTIVVAESDSDADNASLPTTVGDRRLVAKYDHSSLDDADNASLPTTVGDTDLLFTLSTVNSNRRDKNVILYNRKDHKYSINGLYDNIFSVTQYLDLYFSEFNEVEVSEYLSKRARVGKYSGKSSQEIRAYWKRLRDRGSVIHSYIASYYENIENGNLSEKHEVSDEELGILRAFDKYNAKMIRLKCKPYRSEFMIYDEYLLIAGTIDMVYVLNGEFHIVDWKVTNKSINDLKQTNKNKKKKRKIIQIRDTKYDSYTLQLAFYAFILEKQYNIKVSTAKIVLLQTTGDYVEKEVEINNVQKILLQILNKRKKELIDSLYSRYRMLNSYSLLNETINALQES